MRHSKPCQFRIGYGKRLINVVPRRTSESTLGWNMMPTTWEKKRCQDPFRLSFVARSFQSPHAQNAQYTQAAVPSPRFAEPTPRTSHRHNQLRRARLLGSVLICTSSVRLAPYPSQSPGRYLPPRLPRRLTRGRGHMALTLHSTGCRSKKHGLTTVAEHAVHCAFSLPFVADRCTCRTSWVTFFCVSMSVKAPPALAADVRPCRA